MKLSRGLMLASALGAMSIANADLLFDRGLPEANLNNAAGSNRSNVAWADTWAPTDSQCMLGDDFKINGSGAYALNTVRVWVIANQTSPFYGQSMELWGGKASDGVSGLSVLSNAFTATEVKYVDNSIYQGSSTSFIKLWQVDFSVNWLVQGNESQLFFIGGKVQNINGHVYPGYEGYYFSPYLHASNLSKSGTLMEGADNLVYEAVFAGATPGSMAQYDFKPYWDKSSDFNIQVMGERAVPGPAAIVPFAIGLLAAARRRRR